MIPLLAFAGVALLGAAAYTASDPMERSRNWVSAREWEDDPDRAAERQRTYALGMAVLMAGVGLAFLVVGLFPP